MTTINVHEVKTQLPRLLIRVSLGEEVIIARAGKPIARLIAIDEKPLRRTPGSARGQVWIAPDFNAALPPDILDAFEVSA